MPNRQFSARRWFHLRVDERTKNVLEVREAEFPRLHGGDSDEMLLAYLRAFAAELGRTPTRAEIIGGSYLTQRFGTWADAVQAAGLPLPGMGANKTNRLIYKQEWQRQSAQLAEELYRRRHTLRPELTESEFFKDMFAAQKRILLDRAWGEQHKRDTDEELLEYLRACAGQYSVPPQISWITGGHYLAQRFGSWQQALIAAGLK